MFWDEVRIYVKGGDGGNGCISFHREKFVSKGPPDGGNGGHGGNVIFRVNTNINTLTDFSSRKHLRAPEGVNGRKCDQTGANGEDLILDVPLGTQVKAENTGVLLMDLSHPQDFFVAARGGKGGRGNARFVNSVHQAPNIAEKGEPGEEKHLHLELKMVADCAIVGMPNAGKSTLISSISHAKPKIADYPFTTLVPHLEIASIGEKHIVMCDVPGLIEDAHKGKGLGHAFLKHIERSELIIHLLDGNEKNIIKNYQKIRFELESFSKKLLKKKEFVAINKIDTLDEKTLEKYLAAFKKIGVKKVWPISAVTKKGTKELLFALLKELEKRRNKEEPLEEIKVEKKMIFKPHLEQNSLKDFVVEKKGGTFYVRGKRLEQAIVMADFTHNDSILRIENMLKKMGIIKALKKAGAKDGNSFWIGKKEFTYEE